MTKQYKKAARILCILAAVLLLLPACGKKEQNPAQTSEASGPVEQSSQESAGGEQASGEASVEPAAGQSAVLSDFDGLDATCAPCGVAVMPDGAVLITDSYHKRVWRVKDGAGEIYAGGETEVDIYGEPIGGYYDGERLSSYFGRPWDVAAFLDGWAVSDTDNNVVRLVREKEVKTLNVKAEGGKAESGAVFDQPTGLAADAEGNLYILDTGNGTVRRVDTHGVVTTEAEGLTDPMGLCWKDGVLYIAETGANRIVKVRGGEIEAVAGSGEEGMEDGPAQQATFAAPQDVAVGSDGAIYVADMLNGAIRRIQDGQVETVAIRDMTRAQDGLTAPCGLAADGERLYICDNFSRKVFVLEWE